MDLETFLLIVCIVGFAAGLIRLARYESKLSMVVERFGKGPIQVLFESGFVLTPVDYADLWVREMIARAYGIPAELLRKPEDDKTMKCDNCGAEILPDNMQSEEEALAELKAYFGDVPVEDCAVVCDKCWEEMKPSTLLHEPITEVTPENAVKRIWQIETNLVYGIDPIQGDKP